MKISWISVPSEVLPHDNSDSEGDMDAVSSAIADALIQSMPSEIIDLDPVKLNIASLLSSRLIEGIPLNLQEKRWGGKYYSGDLSASLGETMAFALLERKFDVKFVDVIPLRQVKYLGYSPDAIIEIERYPKLLEFVGGKGLLILNARGSYKWSRSWLVRNLRRDLVQVEKMRYPDNFGLLTYFYRDNEWKMMVVTIKLELH